MNITRSIGVCTLGLAIVASPVFASTPDTAFASSATATINAEFAVTSELVFSEDAEFTVTGTGPRNENVWVTLAGADRNDVIALDGNHSGTWALSIPAQYTAGKDEIALAFHHGDSATITKTFTASEDTTTPLEVTSETVFAAGHPLTVTGTAPKRQNVWVTLVDADRNVPIAIDSEWTGAWTLIVPKQYTSDKTELTLAFHYGLNTTITQKFTASEAAIPAFAVTSKPVFAPDDEFTVTGIAPKHQNVWATLADTDRNKVISFDPNGSGKWELTIPAKYTAGKEELALAFHYGDNSTITQTFTKSEDATPSFAVTSKSVFTPDEDLTVTGTAPRNENVWATLVGANRNDPITLDTSWSGKWALTIPAKYTAGKDELALAFHYGDTASITETFTAADGESESPLRVTSPTDYVKGQKITVTGKNTPNQKVELRDTKGALLRTITTNTTGDWTFTTGGTYTADTVTWTLTSGTHEMTHTITAKAESPLRVTSPTDYVKGQKITVTGTNTPNQKINLLDTKGALLRQIPTGNDGTWSFTTGGAYTADTVTWTLTSGTHQTTHTITAKAESPLRVTSPTDYVKGQKITVTGKNTPNKTVELRDTKGTLLRTITTNTTGDWTFTTGGTYTADTVTWTLTSGTHEMTHTITAK
ncbi:Ig-like domain-containing protein [Curtobacterium sp. USHLN213]|uniref:Ig-like domain-containing protein n=1 Tax=Curtobacterium sp. USHLN213 TaxID=3081255 RepID=UPI0030181A98